MFLFLSFSKDLLIFPRIIRPEAATATEFQEYKKNHVPTQHKINFLPVLFAKEIYEPFFLVENFLSKGQSIKYSRVSKGQ